MIKQEHLDKINEIHGRKFTFTGKLFENGNNFYWHKKWYFICSECKKEFEANLNGLICKKHGCKHCKSKKLRDHFAKGKEQFINEAKKIHNYFQYDYSNVEYVNARTKITINCPHGSFFTTPDSHLRGSGCRKCKSEKRKKQNQEKNKKKFIQNAILKHGKKYDYSKVVYNGYNEKVIIICPIHNYEFQQTVGKHLSGRGCSRCSNNYIYSREEWIKRVENKLEKSFIFDFPDKIKWDTKIKTTCKNCGNKQSIGISQLLSNKGCAKCNKTNLLKKEILEKSTKKYKNKFKYDDIHIDSIKEEIDIICNIHGKIRMSAQKHLNSNTGCSFCEKKYFQQKKQDKNFLNFIEKTKKINKTNFLYKRENFKSFNELMIISCTKHQRNFHITPYNHLRAKYGGCEECGHSKNTPNLTIKEFKEKANDIHNLKYDYSLVKFDSKEDMIQIKCPIHGLFTQKVKYHLRGSGCKYCGYTENKRKQTKSTKQFIDEIKKIHGNRYNYSKVKYEGANKEIIVTCTIHGDFSQIASKHLNGAGCSKCNGGMTYNKEFFIEKANEVHVNKYDYSKVTYTKGTEEVIIICPVHGQFKQKPEYHLSGNGCHKCRSSKAERKIIKKLKSYKIKFDHTYTINIENRNLYCDIFLKEYKLIIEYDGPQHFIPVPFSGKKDPNKTIENFYNTVERDNLKNKFAETNKYKIIRIPYWIYEVSIIKDLFENDKINEYSKIYSLENNRKYFILNQKKLIQKVPGFTKHISPFFDLTKLEQIFKV